MKTSLLLQEFMHLKLSLLYFFFHFYSIGVSIVDIHGDIEIQILWALKLSLYEK